nr:immunoglobulin heavy chain junction region [Macaca mulatta]MOX59153.1 immunoglobulin heavy chain junction region [Macaca mulatta]MOX59522.1 immunoglobulin heavy chain junction region [Macaca mulatta]MOX59817.1 immunoglobulin heavy chain junction region [Macaca mulatta]MOX60245.1 immunoglobulin heavy chain junction region [Macaca mulatta]
CASGGYEDDSGFYFPDFFDSW